MKTLCKCSLFSWWTAIEYIESRINSSQIQAFLWRICPVEIKKRAGLMSGAPASWLSALSFTKIIWDFNKFFLNCFPLSLSDSPRSSSRALISSLFENSCPLEVILSGETCSASLSCVVLTEWFLSRHEHVRKGRNLRKSSLILEYINGLVTWLSSVKHLAITQTSMLIVSWNIGKMAGGTAVTANTTATCNMALQILLSFSRRALVW